MRAQIIHASRKPRAPREERELAEQIALFQFRDLHKTRYPELAWLHSSLNGVYLTPSTRRKASASGMTSGVWDVLLPVVRYTECKAPSGEPSRRISSPGLYIEMKARGGKLSPAQKAFRDALEPDGWEFRIAYTWLEAANQILDYLGIDDKELRYHLRLNTKGASL